MLNYFKKNWQILSIIFLSFLLNSFYIKWGLPSKWHPDEGLYISDVVNMFLNMKFNTNLPSCYRYFLFLLLTPYFIFIKLFNFDFNIDFVYLLSRYISAILGTLVVYILYKLTKIIYDKKTANLTALFCSLNMGFVNIFHFATTDAFVLFLISIAFLFSAYIFKYKKDIYYVGCGIAIGFATATKIIPFLFVFIVLLIHFLDYKNKICINYIKIKILLFFAFIFFLVSILFLFKKDIFFEIIKKFSPDGIIDNTTFIFLDFFRRFFILSNFIIFIFLLLSFKIRLLHNFIIHLIDKKISAFFVMVFLCFIIGNPFLFIKFRNFIDYIIYFFNYTHFSGLNKLDVKIPTFVYYVYVLNNIFGLPLFLLCIFGFLYGTLNIRRDKFSIVLISWILIFYLFLSFQNLVRTRFILPIVLSFLILSARFSIKILENKNILIRNIFIIFLIFVILYTFFYVLTLEFMFRYDTRKLAGDWIRKNIPTDSVIYAYSNFLNYLPDLDYSFYNIKIISNQQNVDFLEPPKGDYLIFTSFYYEYFINNKDYPNISNFFNNIINGKADYKLIKKFEFKGILKPKPEFVSPIILIFKK